MYFKDKIKYSVLDLVPIAQGSNIKKALIESVELAKYTEKLGFFRYWVAEHHSMPGIGSAATSIVMNHIASNTKTIRIGAGGIMLPNHAPLIIAEQFGTLDALHPNRIDLGLGRAPGTNPETMLAIRGDAKKNGNDFPEKLSELRAFFAGNPIYNEVRAIPGENTNIPIWLLGSSDFSAILAGKLGLPFAFASHFSPNNTNIALKYYYDNFKPGVLEEPHTMVAINVFAANTKKEAERISTSSKQQFLSLIRNKPALLPPPVDNMDEIWSEHEKLIVQSQLKNTIIGDENTIKSKIQEFINMTKANEIIIVSSAFDIKDRLNSYKIIAQAMNIRD
ncbi:MAG: LLM class flavin-dependent oxidoreductase [Defluviitaleaceae bacterium]|nr:LLM class flavin-dependent oxidoreductase [Defluviitaleaceae bacterium]